MPKKRVIPAINQPYSAPSSAIFIATAEGADYLKTDGSRTLNGRLTLVQQAADGAIEILATFSVADGAGSYLRIENATTANNVFVPVLATLQAEAEISRFDLARIGLDTGSNPCIVMDARTGAGAAVTTRPIIDWRTAGASLMILTADGQLGIGETSPTGILSIRPGAANYHANVGGVIYTDTTHNGNTGSGEDILLAFSVPADTLSVNDQSLWFEAAGSTANNANSKTLRARFGSSGTSLIISQVMTVSVSGRWILRGRVFRTGASSQVGYAALNGGNGQDSGAGMEPDLNQDLTGTVSLRITAQAVADNDVTIESLIVGWDDKR